MRTACSNWFYRAHRKEDFPRGINFDVNRTVRGSFFKPKTLILGFSRNLFFKNQLLELVNKNSWYIFFYKLLLLLLLLSIIDRVWSLCPAFHGSKLSQKLAENEYFERNHVHVTFLSEVSLRVFSTSTCVFNILSPRENSFDKVGRCTRGQK